LKLGHPSEKMAWAWSINVDAWTPFEENGLGLEGKIVRMSTLSAEIAGLGLGLEEINRNLDTPRGKWLGSGGINCEDEHPFR